MTPTTGRSRLAATLLVVLLSAGCATVDPYAYAPIAQHLERADEAGDCARLLRAVDRRIDALGVRDAGAPRVPGFPHLRVDRFTAALGERAAALGAYDAWTELMARLDLGARVAELANAADPQLPSAASIDACRHLLATRDVDRLAALRAAARVPDDYATAARFFGLYALTRVPFAIGVRRYQADTEATFATPLAELPRLGTPVRYVPPSQVDELPAVAASAVFELPALPRALAATWIAHHAPELVVDTETPSDRLGALRWQRSDDGALRLAVAADEPPQATVRIAFMPFDGRPRAQLVYTFWFPRRPAQSAFDLLAGEIDALVWRVTLDEQGAPLVYDSMHACGCYHQFFPTARVRARPTPADAASRVDETLFAPQTLPAPAPSQRVRLHVAARTHYLQRIELIETESARDASATSYTLVDDDRLRALPLPGGGHRSAFGRDGLMPGSERAERWLFWPMGIASAGQMRQWGRHATAFVGRRHFDDPWLLDRYFERVAGAGEP